MREAGRLARAALQQAGLGDEQACYLYRQILAERTCACGCGEAVSGRASYVDGAHRTRAYRNRVALRMPQAPRQ
jgi:hypothetical protein